MVAVRGDDIAALRPHPHAVQAHQTRDALPINQCSFGTQLRRHAPVAVSLKLAPDRVHALDERGLIQLTERLFVKSASGQLHHAASFGNGEASGPVITEGLASLGVREACEAFLRRSFSSASRPTIRS